MVPNGRFPIEVRGAAYTDEQAKSQVSLLLAERDGYDQSVRELKEVQDTAERQMESLAVRINATDSQLTGLSAKRELLRARQLSDEGRRLLAQVDQLLDGNAQLIEGNPVHTVRELLAAPGSKSGQAAGRQRVEECLTPGP